MKYIVALDQGTTSSRAIAFDHNGDIVAVSQKEFTQIFPQAGWVEHNPLEIWESQLSVFEALLSENSISPDQVDAIGITNQRETAVVWDKNTGKPVYNAIVWQDKRTANICDDMKSKGLEPYIRENTGLVIDSYFSGTKVKWILDEVEGAKEKANNGDLLFGTVDTWLIWNLTKGKSHVTDYTNASRTLIYNIVNLNWDNKLMQELGIPESMLPTVQKSSGDFGTFNYKGVDIPILGVAGDQQAALFGQACFNQGQAKNTYGTGCFMLMNTGDQLQHSKNGLLTTLACSLDSEVDYALEGSIFVAGAAVQWLRDGLELVKDAADTEEMAVAVGDSNDVYVVPAFAGLGAPYWDMYSRGAIFGLTRGTGKNEIAKATLDSIAYQTKDVLTAMEDDSGISLDSLRVDGGAVANNYLMQFQADILGVNVERPAVIESTALGAAYLAGLASEYWKKEDLQKNKAIERTFQPQWDDSKIDSLYQGWKKAVNRTMNWVDAE
ncbi:MAG: glycerol kinase GlpK [bacterium]|nr:glycerol kinase GlpK [bacterium]